MKLPAAERTFLLLLAAVAAVVLCTLPFFAVKKDVIRIYTRSLLPDSREDGFVRELKRLGFSVRLNESSMPQEGEIAVWFKSPEYAERINRSEALYNFIYNEDYYTFDWQGLENAPIVLTPYRELYEHYARSNVKTAIFTLGVNPADYYFAAESPNSGYKKYPVVYLGDNNKESPLAEKLRRQKNVRFLGSSWEKDEQMKASVGTAREQGEALAKTWIVAVYSKAGSPEDKRVPPEVAEATAAGALVIMSFNSAVKELYGDNVIMYQNEDDFSALAEYYLKHKDIMMDKTVAAQKITADKMSSATSARRFKELLDWLKSNR